MVDHNPFLLRSMFDNFSYAYKLLNNLAKRSLVAKTKMEDVGFSNDVNSMTMTAFFKAPQFDELVFCILGISELISVSYEVSKQSKNKELQKMISDLNNEFPYKNIRDILAHWEDYSRGKGDLQKSGIVEKKDPFMTIDNFSKIHIYHYIIDIVELRNKVIGILNKTHTLTEILIRK